MAAIVTSPPRAELSPGVAHRVKTPSKSALKSPGGGQRRRRPSGSGGRLTFVSTPIIREYYDDTPVKWALHLREDPSATPSAMSQGDLQRELDVRGRGKSHGSLAKRDKARYVEETWRQEIEEELKSYGFPVGLSHSFFFPYRLTLPPFSLFHCSFDDAH